MQAAPQSNQRVPIIPPLLLLNFVLVPLPMMATKLVLFNISTWDTPPLSFSSFKEYNIGTININIIYIYNIFNN